MIDTWNNIHLFQTFDYNISNPLDIAKSYDFVWGAQSDHVSAYRQANPDMSLSYYIPFNSDWGTFPNSNTQHDLAYWKATHPDWILYRCDRVTPAYHTGYATIPLDFTNPAFINWQAESYARPASTSGYDTLAVDNIILNNAFGACGVYRNGQWVQLYTGQADDPQWRADIISWLKQMQQIVHHLAHPMALVANVNQGSLPLTDPQVQQVVSSIDGMLDEDGFTRSGTGYLTGDDWLQKVQFIENVQKQHKPYYTIDAFPLVGSSELQWAIASYLMSKEHASALYISPLGSYGSALWYDEYGAQIGSPIGSMYQMQDVYLRNYSNGLSIVNPSATETHTLTLSAGQHYSDLSGAPVDQVITLPPHSGKVLLLNS